MGQTAQASGEVWWVFDDSDPLGVGPGPEGSKMPLKSVLAVPIALLVLLMAAPTAYSQEPVVEPVTTQTTVTVPTLVPGLIMVIATDANGLLTSVDLHSVDDPTGDAPADYVATKVDNRRVRFQNTVTGTTVEVKAKENKIETKVRSATLNDLVGTHTWEGPILGEPVKVTFAVGDDGTGIPTVGDVVVEPADNATIQEPSTKVESDEIETKLKIRFANDLGQRADLKIEIEVHFTDDDGNTVENASLKIALKVKDDKIEVPTTDVTTLPNSWTGALCDGTPLSVNWTNNANGTLSDVVFSPEAEEFEMSDHEFKVRFADDAKVKVEIEFEDDGGRIKLKIEPEIRCEDGPAPSVNTDIDIRNSSSDS